MSSISELEIFRIFLQILIDGPHWKKGKPEETAIFLLPGVHQEYRITEGVKLWPNAGKYLWVAGTRGDPTYSKEDIIAVTGKGPEIQIPSQGCSIKWREDSHLG